MSIFTGDDLYLGHYLTELGNYIFVFLDNEKKFKYEILVPLDYVDKFLIAYPKINKNIFYSKD